MLVTDDYDMNDHFARSSICDGRYEVEDRGEAIAEISVASNHAFTRKIVGYVHADVGLDYDEAGHILSTASAFPGTVTMEGSDLPKEPVATIEELERLLERHDRKAALWKSAVRSAASELH